MIVDPGWEKLLPTCIMHLCFDVSRFLRSKSFYSCGLVQKLVVYFDGGLLFLLLEGIRLGCT